MQNTDYLLVKTAALPAVFAKVAQAKLLLSTGRVKSSSEAVRLCGLSRSAYYKYRDCVFSVGDQGAENVINLSAVLENRSGVLSAFIGALCAAGANILTINQGLPAMGVASVTVSYRRGAAAGEDALLADLKRVKGVVSVSRVLGEL